MPQVGFEPETFGLLSKAFTIIISRGLNFTVTGHCIPELSSFDRVTEEGLVVTGVPIFFPALTARCLAFTTAETTLWEW